MNCSQSDWFAHDHQHTYSTSDVPLPGMPLPYHGSLLKAKYYAGSAFTLPELVQHQVSTPGKCTWLRILLLAIEISLQMEMMLDISCFPCGAPQESCILLGPQLTLSKHFLQGTEITSVIFRIEFALLTHAQLEKSF